MNINIGLDKDFEKKFKELKNKYGEKMASLNGLADSQLNYNDFIDNFVDTSVVADSSIDPNANVGHKDVVTLEHEMSKPHYKLLALNKIYYEMKKQFSKEEADEWFEYEFTRALYLHDAPTSSTKPYCYAYTLKDLAEKGLYFIEGYNAEPAKHLGTFVTFLKEFVSYASNRTSGACGLPNLIPYMYYFWDRDVKNGYYTETPEEYAKQNIQSFIYAINQPYCRDGSQSAFVNTNIFDHEYLMALFGGEVFPDGAYMVDELEGIMKFQKMFLEEMSEIRSHNMFTFPVNSISLIKKDGKFVDEEFAKWACEHNRKWNDSNFFVDDSVTSLSSCCFDGSQMTLTKSSAGVNFMSFKELKEASYDDTKNNFGIFHNGSWVKGKIVTFPKTKMYKITTVNNKEIFVTYNHINPTLRGDIQTNELTTDDYLLFNTVKVNNIVEVDKHLTYEQGFLIGMYLGDGSMGNEDYETFTKTVALSLNKEKYETSIAILNKAVEQICSGVKINLGKPYNNVYPVTIRNNEVHRFIREYVSGKYGFEKSLNMDCILQSVDFRQGIVDGYYLTDGGNSNRIYTTSRELISCMEALFTSLGKQTIIDVSDRRDEDVVIREGHYKRNHPVYCIRWYGDSNKRQMKNIYIKRNNSIYFKIKNIEEFESANEEVYCFEMDNKNEPYFTLPNGIITHNCRLKNDIKELGYFNSIGGTALRVGSVKVSTINLARIAYESKSEKEYLKKLEHTVNINLKALHIVRSIIKRNIEKGLLPNYTYGLVDLSTQYNTCGFVGVYETMKSFGYTYMDKFDNTFYNDKAFEFGKKIFEVIHKTKDEFSKDKDYKVNVEQAPAESAATKLQESDILLYPEKVVDDLPLYANQFIGLGIKTTMKERIRIASAFDSYCSGGSILHANIEAPFTNFEQAWNMLNYITDQGVTYFAFNTKIQVCEDNHAFFGKKCPVCGKPVEGEYSRVVGFYTKTSTWSKERRNEFKLRKWADTTNENTFLE